MNVCIKLFNSEVKLLAILQLPDFVSAQEDEDLINLKSKAFAQQLVIGFQNVAEGARRVLDAFSGKKGH